MFLKFQSLNKPFHSFKKCFFDLISVVQKPMVSNHILIITKKLYCVEFYIILKDLTYRKKKTTDLQQPAENRFL